MGMKAGHLADGLLAVAGNQRLVSAESEMLQGPRESRGVFLGLMQKRSRLFQRPDRTLDLQSSLWIM